MSENAPLQFDIDSDLMLDILSTGMEYAAGQFWAQIEEFNWQWWYADGKGGGGIAADVHPTTTLIRIRDAEKSDDSPFVDINLTNLKAAIQWALTNHAHEFAYTVSDNIVTDIDYDVDGADIIVQRIVLGEVIYG